MTEPTLHPTGRALTSMMRPLAVAALGLLLALVVGCGDAGSPATDADAAQSTASAHSATAVHSVGDGPSESAKMICGTAARQAIAIALALPALPETTSNWADHEYTCSYALPAGPLVLTVHELADAAAAQGDFEAKRAAFGATEPIVGLASLGLPGFKTAAANVVFAKDNMTLHVDATALPATLGPNEVTRADFAYQVATNILGCWTGD